MRTDPKSQSELKRFKISIDVRLWGFFLVFVCLFVVEEAEDDLPEVQAGLRAQTDQALLTFPSRSP